MHVTCRLREIRGRRGLRDIAAAAGVNRGSLSLIELGRMLPKDDWLPALEHAYGAPRTTWYPPETLLVLHYDDGGDA